MGISKTEAFSRRQQKLALVARALAHPARIAILDYLLRQNSCICNDLVSRLPLAQSTVSGHLQQLKEAGLIKGTIEGPAMNYCIDPEGWAESSQLLQSLFETRLPRSGTC